jgi:hypothetical protein
MRVALNHQHLHAAAVRALHDHLEASGVTIRKPFAEHGGYVTFIAADPDGYGIEVYCDPALAPESP